MDLRERAHNALSHLNFRARRSHFTAPIDQGPEQSPNPEPPKRVEFEFESPRSIRAQSRFGEDAVRGKPYQIPSREELKQLWERRDAFFHTEPKENLVYYDWVYDEEKFPELLETVITGPNAKPFTEAFTTVEDAIKAHWESCSENNDYQARDQREGHYKSISMFLPETVMETAPPSLKKLVKEAQIPTVPYRHDYYGIDTKGILVDLYHQDGRMEMGIGGLSGRDERYSQRFELEISLFWGTSNLEFKSFESAFQTPNELRRYIESFNDEARRARLFYALAKFFAKSLDNPDIVTLNHRFDSWVNRSRPKEPQTALAS